MTVRPPGQSASASAEAAVVIAPAVAACAASSSSNTIPLSGGRRFAANSRSIPPGVDKATAIP
jgi:hypothetical protein